MTQTRNMSTSQSVFTCDLGSNRATPTSCKSVESNSSRSAIQAVIFLIISLVVASQCPPSAAWIAVPSQEPIHLVGQAGEQVQLPCLVGKQLFCGEPYFIAWYKQNATTKNWLRVEYSTASADSFDESLGAGASRFSFVRSATSCPNHQRLEAAGNFDCAHLAISSLELSDEANYKCEITFAESLDFDKCPASTLSQLSVVDTKTTFKEGTQVKLECLSSGGKPAPRIEWLNISIQSWTGNNRQPLEHSAEGQLRLAEGAQVQLMRSQWPQKKATYSSVDVMQVQAAGWHQNGSSNSHLPVTVSSITLALSRFDLQSQFACLVLPSLSSTGDSGAHQQILRQQEQALEHQLVKNPAFLESMLAARAQSGAMLKWLKLDVSVKPSGVLVSVVELETGAKLEPVDGSQFGLTPPNTPIYLVRPNRAYAIQCRSEESRPASQFAWFNRSAPLGVDQLALSNSSTSQVDFLEPQDIRRHRMSGFTRTIERPNGTFRTTASLVLTTNIWDDFEEFFCRVSNSAFQLDELVQVAPIISAKLYVNYAPFAQLQVDGAKWVQADSAATDQQITGKLNASHGSSVSMKCTVSANPLNQNMILQIDWLRDAKTLQQSARVRIEKANHLHMARSNRQNQLTPSSKLIGSSTLTLSQISARNDAGLYKCQFKLIPSTTSSKQQSTQSLSGQSSQVVQLNVIEAKPPSPTLRISASKGLLVYGISGQPARGPSSNSKQINQKKMKKMNLPLVAIIIEDGHENSAPFISLHCDLATESGSSTTKVSWFKNGIHQFSVASSSWLNFTLHSTATKDNNPNRLIGGQLSCAHHLDQNTDTGLFHANQPRVLHSTNEIHVRLKDGPKLHSHRRDLMPLVRSFSEHELGAKLGSKLKMTCLARCEPLCSIDWYFNRKPIRQQLSSADSTSLNELNSGLNNTQSFTFRHFDEAQSDLFGGQMLHSQSWTVAPKNKSSDFSWHKQSALIATTQRVDTSNPALLDWMARNLNRDALESYAGQQDANVFSRLEISYDQIQTMLVSHRMDSVEFACKLNPTLNGQSSEARLFGHSLLAPNMWFPPEKPSSSSSQDQDEDGLDQLDDVNELDSNSDSNLEYEMPLNLSQFNSEPPSDDQLQTKIFLDKPPKFVVVSFAGIESTSLTPNSVTLTESQLLDLTDPGKTAPPLLQCTLDSSNLYPGAQFKWTFTDLNGTTHSMFGEGSQLNLRQIVEFRQRQMNADPTNAFGLNVIAGLVGNYTCTGSNMHGSKSATMSLFIQGRPLCKLSLGAEYLGASNELYANLQCQVYSMPPMLETVWFKGNQQIASNKSALDVLAWTKSPVFNLELPIEVLNKDQDFMLSDMISSSSNFKCLVRNPMGYSEACELSQLDRQIILSAFKANSGSSPALSVSLFPEVRAPNLAPNFLSTTGANGSSNDQSSSNQMRSFMRTAVSRFDLILLVSVCLAITWLLSMLACSFGRRRVLGKNCTAPGRQVSGWRFRGHHGSSNGSSGSRTSSPKFAGLPGIGRCSNEAGAPNLFAATATNPSKVCVNYYGAADSNGGDSEHDMVQSCSQSSHYEDFVLNHQQQQSTARLMSHHELSNQPLYFNANSMQSATLSRPILANPGRLLKKSLSGSGTSQANDNNYSTKQHPFPLGIRLDESALDARAAMANHYAAATRNLSQVASSTLRQPLINGQSSRINLQHQRRQATLQTGQINEHIYDDVVYNQVIL